MKKESEKELKQTRLVIILLAFIILLVFIVGVLIGERRNKNTKTYEQTKVVDKKEEEPTSKSEEEKKEETTSKSKDEKQDDFSEVSINSSYLDDVPKIPEFLCGGIIFPVKQKDIYLKDLTDNDKLNLLISGVSSKLTVEGNDDYELFELSDKIVQKYFEDTSFLDDIKKNGFNSGDSNTKYSVAEPIFIESKNNKIYVGEYATGCEGPGKDRETVKLVSVKKNSQKLVMTYKYYYIKVYYDEKSDDFINDVYISKKDSTAKYKNISWDDKLDLSDFDSYDMYFDITNGNIRFEKMSYNEAK